MFIPVYCNEGPTQGIILFPGAALLQIAEVHKEINTQVIDNVSMRSSVLSYARWLHLKCGWRPFISSGGTLGETLQSLIIT